MTDLSEPVRCKVKWYNTAKGFGFVVPEDGPPDDWFLHATVLQKAGVTALGEGAILTCDIGEGMKGLCVKKVLEIHDHGAPPSMDGAPRQRDGFGGGGGRSQFGNRDGFDRGPRGPRRDGFGGGGRGGYDGMDGGGAEEDVSGTVKWYDNTKEFGFITPDDGMKDIFIHKTCLERYGVAALEPGQKIRIKSRNVPKGREAKDILQLDQ